jgi:hypothetical protein
MESKEPQEGSKRAKVRERYGYDAKFAYHVVRLQNEAEQIQLEGDLDLMRNREQLKSICRGEWTEQQVIEYFERKRVDLEQVRSKSTLPPGPDVEAIRAILLQCLEAHYGTLDRCVVVQGRAETVLRQIKDLIDSAGY